MMNTLCFGLRRSTGGTYRVGPSTETGANADGDKSDNANASGYSHSGQNMNELMGVSRIGSVGSNITTGYVDPDSVLSGGTAKKRNPLGGVLESGEWRAAVQWLDRWGNVSPISGLSEAVTVDKQDNLLRDKVGGWTSNREAPEKVERLRVQIAWTGISKGPDGTVGRILCRTRDSKRSGVTGVFEVPNYSGTGISTISSIPDYIVEDFPDNIPDSWLL